MILKARVRGGRLILDEPTELPEGAEVDLLPVNPPDWLDELDRPAPQRPPVEADEDGGASRLASADEVLRALRSK